MKHTSLKGKLKIPHRRFQLNNVKVTEILMFTLSTHFQPYPAMRFCPNPAVSAQKEQYLNIFYMETDQKVFIIYICRMYQIKVNEMLCPTQQN